MFGLRGKLSDNLIFASEPTDESLLSFGASDANIYLSRFVTASILFILASFVFMSILGMGMGMETKDGQMSGCPFMAGQTTMCQMSVTEHIARWREMVLGILKGDFLSLAIILLAVVLIPSAKPFSKLEELNKFAARLSAYHKTHPVKVFDPLLLAFSDGILNPRIYELVRI